MERQRAARKKMFRWLKVRARFAPSRISTSRANVHVSISDWSELGATEKGNFSQARRPGCWDFLEILLQF